MMPIEEDEELVKEFASKQPKQGRVSAAASKARRAVYLAKASFEFFGRHPLITGILGVLGVVGLLISIQSYRVDRSESRETTLQLDKLVESTKFVSDCGDRDVYLQVMADARRLPDPYSQWTLRGSTGSPIEIGKGICSMTLLYVTGHSEGLMTEVNVTYTAEPEVAIRSINSIKTPGEGGTKILLDTTNRSTVYGILGPEKTEKFYIEVEPGKKVRLHVGPSFRNVAATVAGIGDMREEFEFTATKKRHDFFVAQLFRSVSDEEFWIRVEID